MAELVFTYHHALVDGWSTPLLTSELVALYGGATLPPAIPYRNYLGWLAGQDQSAGEGAWRTALAGLDEPTLLAGSGRLRDPALPDAVSQSLPAALSDGLTALARDRGVTLNTVLQLGWGVLLARLTGRTDVVFGATVSGRPAELPGVESMIGLFINTVPVRVRYRPAEPIADVLDRLQDQQATLLPHQHVGLAETQRLAGLGELFDTLTVFENYPLEEDQLRAGGLQVSEVAGHDAAHYPLTLIVEPGETALGRRRVPRRRVRRGPGQHAGRPPGADPHRVRRRPRAADRPDRRAGPGRAAGRRIARSRGSAGPARRLRCSGG